MANKRNLKKQVRYICGDIATECMLASTCIDGVDAKEMGRIVAEIAHLQEVALSSVSFSFDKVRSDFASKADYRKARSTYNRKAFTALREKFNNRIREIVKEMNAALPQAAKDANKENK